MPGGLTIINKSSIPLEISLAQIGPLYYGVYQPGETFDRSTGRVWFTVNAVVSPDGKGHINDWDVAMPILTFGGIVIATAVSAGLGAVLSSLGISLGAFAEVSIAGVVVGAGEATAEILTAILKKDGLFSRSGVYADRSKYVITGGPKVQIVGDKAYIDFGEPLQMTRANEEEKRISPMMPGVKDNYFEFLDNICRQIFHEGLAQLKPEMATYVRELVVTLLEKVLCMKSTATAEIDINVKKGPLEVSVGIGNTSSLQAKTFYLPWLDTQLTLRAREKGDTIYVDLPDCATATESTTKFKKEDDERIREAGDIEKGKEFAM